MRHARWVFPQALFLVLGCSESTGPEGSYRTERFTWSGQVEPGAAVEIKNTNGDVRARPSRDGAVRVVAVKEGRDDDPSTVRIEVVETTNGVTICAVYPDVPGHPANECLPGPAGQLSSRDNDVSVTFDVEVPPGCAFRGATTGGSVEATDLSGYVDALTVAGNIAVSTSGIARATTVNGDIAASIGQASWDQDLAFTATTGDVTLRIPAHTSADVWGSTTNGSVSTDFPLNVTRVGVSGQLRGRLGDGGRRLSITVVSGDIALLAR